MERHTSVLVVFDDVHTQRSCLQKTYDVVVSSVAQKDACAMYGKEWVSLESLVTPGSVYEANALVQRLSQGVWPDGVKLSQTVSYKGYHLWWFHYSSLFHTRCLPYTQYTKLFSFLKSYTQVTFCNAPHEELFLAFTNAHGLQGRFLKKRSSYIQMPVGIYLQIVLTLVSLPFLVCMRRSYMVFTGDKFAAGKDYDARMSFIYGALRDRKLPFIEFVRSLESWKTILEHALVRRRPVVYSVALYRVALWLSIITGGRRRATQLFHARVAHFKNDPDTYFVWLLAAEYLARSAADIWAIRINHLILWCIGVRALFIPAATERSFHTVVAAKMVGAHTVGVLHGAAILDYNVYDFLPTFDGEKPIALDVYGVWSAWWKEYYLTHGRAYTEDQLKISGPMRPFIGEIPVFQKNISQGEPIKVLFIAEQLAAPSEVLPYVRALLESDRISLYVKFRPYRDGFEMWLREHHPELLNKIDATHIFRGDMQSAIAACDITVGSHSTAVLEALLALKPIAFFETGKWGDAFSLAGYHAKYTFYAKTPQALLEAIEQNVTVEESVLKMLQERFFGDPQQNGSAWAVDELVSFVTRNTKK